MAHHCIKYRLNADGTIPSFLCLHPEGVGGMFVVGDPSTPSPRDMVMIGLSENDDTGDAELVPTKQALQDYLEFVGAYWMERDFSNPDDPEALVPFDPEKWANWVWDRKAALDSAA